MKTYKVTFSDQAIADLNSIAAHIESKASARTALEYIERIEDKCMSLTHFPERGTLRTDLGAGLRTFGIERRVTVLFHVEKDERSVTVLGVFYGGREVRLG